ncbi:MAG TPA: hypothetical protein PKA15_11230, partial [Chitinophagales bacterium]|nr:hypothetical protein [Chitinophagales bacterium]
KEIELPFEDSSPEYTVIKKNIENWESRMNSNIPKELNRNFINFHILKFIPDEKSFELSEGYGEYRNWHLELENENSEIITIPLREDIINEGIAYTVEYLIDKYHLKVEEFVNSDIIYKIIPTIFADGKFSIILLLVLCDLSLQTNSPGENLVYYISKYFEKLQEDYQVNITNEKIEEYLNIYKDEINSLLLQNYHDKLMDKFNNIIEEIKDIIPFISWIDNLYDKGLNHILDSQLPEYIIPLIYKKSNEENISKVIKNFQPPVVTDNLTKSEEKFIFFDLFDEKKEGEEHINYNLTFPALNYFYKFIKYNYRGECPNFSLCKKEYKNEDCLNNPWNKIYKEDLCNIGYLFSKIKFIERN